MVVARDRIEPPFRGPFLSLLWNDTRRMGMVAQGNPKHFPGCRHFQVERYGKPPAQRRYVLVGNMPAIFAQVGGDSVGTGPDGKFCGAHRVWVKPSTSVADGGDVVDIHAQSETRRHGMPSLG
jgi:hypothetical protein